MSDLLPAKPYFGRAEISPSASISGDRPDGALRAIEDAREQDKTATEAATRNFAARAIVGRDRAKDLLAAATWNSGEGLFQAWQDKVNGALAAAYPVFLHLLGGGAEALNEVLNHPALLARQRRHTKNLALIALQLVAQPSDDTQAKALSEYAPFLKYAALQQIEPGDFPARMANVTLKTSKELVRAKAREGQARSKIAAQADGPLTTTPDNQPETESATAERPEPPASNSMAITSAIKETTAEKALRTASRTTWLEPSIMIAVVDATGNSRTLRLKLTAAQAKASLALLSNERCQDPSSFLVSLGIRLKRPTLFARRKAKKAANRKPQGQDGEPVK